MLENMLIHVVSIQRPVVSKDSSGGMNESDYAPTYLLLSACVQPVQAKWQVQYAQRQINISHTVYFNRSLAIAEGDQVIYGSRVLRVQGVRNLIEQGRVLAVDCLEVT